MSEPVESAEVSHCRSCGAAIIWARTAAGKLCPYDLTDEPLFGLVRGGSHFGTCNDPKRWSKRQTKGPRP